MKIKRFSGPDMRRTLRKVSDELGPDAVILSNQKIDDGIEIVAAIDYDESLLADNPTPNKSYDNEYEAKTVDDQRQAALDDIRYGRNLP